MKRLLSFVLALAMFISCVQWGAIPLTAWGEGDTSDIIWTDLESVLTDQYLLGDTFYNIPAGNYYLTRDFTMTYGIIIKADVTLNLNDHILTINDAQAWAVNDDTVADSGIVVYGGSLTLVDSPVDGSASTARYWDTDTGEIKTNTTIDDAGTLSVTGTNAFTGGAITGGDNDRDVLGGGAICVYSGSFTMESGNLVGNATDHTGILGGAVYVNANATFTMESGSIIGNTSGGLAGAVYIQCNGTFNMYEGSTIAHNSTGTTANYAGAVYNVGTFNMYGGLIDSNESMGGGAVSTVAGWKAGSGVFTMYGGAITNNYATTSGGAVLIGSGGTFVMVSGSITGNSTSGTGGAINLQYDNSTATIYGGTITNNTATGVAGGIRVNGGVLNIGNIGQDTTPITITGNTGDGVESNVYLFSGSTITQVGSLDADTCAVGVTLQAGTGTAAISGSDYTIVASGTDSGTDDVAPYASDEGYYRILSGTTVILREAGEIPGTDIEIEYADTPYDITAPDAEETEEILFDLSVLAGTGATVTYTLLSTGTGVGTFDAATNELTVTQIGTFDFMVQTSYTTLAEPKIGTATLTVTPSSNISITWPTASDFVYGGNQDDNSELSTTSGTATITTVSGDGDGSSSAVEIDGTFSWLNPITSSDDLQNAGSYTGTVTFTPDEDDDDYSNDYAEYFSALTQAVAYNITPRDVTISGLVAIGRGPMAGVYGVTLNEADGSIGGVAGDDASGIINDDSVSISFDSYTANITDTTYHRSSNDAYYTSGSYSESGTFEVVVTGLTLTGADAANYHLISTSPTTVIITQSTPYVAWPTATNIIYGETQGDSTLNGGKVYLQNEADADGNITYTDITDTGSFVWVTPSSAVQDAGTYTGTVQFVLNSDISADDASYKTALEALTRDIDYLIEAAAVSFTVTDNSVAYGSYVHPTISVVSYGVDGTPAPVEGADDGYTVQYLQLVNGVYEYVTSPTEVGTYFIGIGFHSIGTDANGNLLYNYYHTGTSVSTAKQIGVLVIYDYEVVYSTESGHEGETEVNETPPTTYSLTFTGYAAEETTSYDVSDALEQTIHILPTLEGDAYLGWAAEDGTVYAFGSRYAQPAYDMVFTAVLAPDSHTISGTVTGYELYDIVDTGDNADTGDTGDTADTADTATTLSNVSVVLMSGNDQIATTTTDASGHYAFDVTPGRYTVEFTLDYGDIKYIESVFADATDGNAVVDMYFPKERFNVELDLGAGMDGITVDGLQDILNELSSNKTVPNSVVFGITQVDVTSNEYFDLLAAATYDGLTSDNVKLFYDVQITEEKEVGTVTDVASVSDLFAIYIPLAGMYQAKENYAVYRSITDAQGNITVDVLKTTPNSAGEYIKLADDGQTLVIYAKASALYAISFTEPAPAVLEGVDMTLEYSTATIDVSELGMFDLTGLGEATYTITAETGAGSILGDYLKVSSVGTFTVSVSTAATASVSAMQGSATLTITPKEIDVYDLVGVSRGAAEGDDYVEIDPDASDDSYTFDGLINHDDVGLVYDDAYGRIYLEYETDLAYTDASYYSEETSTATFGMVAGGITLTGDDKDNYVLDEMYGAVTISIATPYIAWPTAPDITYGQDLSDSTLYGGKVIVYDPEYDNGDGNDKGGYVTLTGTFEWVNEKYWVEEVTDGDSTSLSQTTTAVSTTDIGTYTQYVKFTPTNTSYSETFASIYHEVEVIVKATAVQFTVSDNDVEYILGNAQYATVTATASVADILTESDYVIQYYQFGTDGIEYIANPADVGTYFVAAYFTSTNFHHTGTLESTGKQIGVLYIRAVGSDATATYDVTFVGVDGVAYQDYAVTDALQDTIHILPTITETDEYGNAAYVGWEYNGSVYDFGARFGQPATDVTFTAVAAPDSYAVSGTVYGVDLNGDEDAPLSNIAVAIMQGSETVATLETDASGYFSVDLPTGYYTIVITRDQVVKNEVSVHIEVTNKAVSLGHIVLPDVAQNTVLEIASGVAVASVDGLDDMLDYYLAQDADLPSAISNTIKVDIANIDIVDDAQEKTEYDAIMAKAWDTYSISADNLKLFFDVSVWRTYGSDDPEQISTIPGGEYLEIYITLPGTYQGDYTYQVYRYHTYDTGVSQVDVLTTTPNAYGEKIELMADGQTLKVTAKFYSVYGVAYLPVEASDSDGKTEDSSGSASGSSSSSSSSASVTVTTTETDTPTSPATGESGIVARIVNWLVQVFA